MFSLFVTTFPNLHEERLNIEILSSIIHRARLKGGAILLFVFCKYF